MHSGDGEPHPYNIIAFTKMVTDYMAKSTRIRVAKPLQFNGWGFKEVKTIRGNNAFIRTGEHLFFECPD
jgi:hypothetical protein